MYMFCSGLENYNNKTALKCSQDVFTKTNEGTLKKKMKKCTHPFVETSLFHYTDITLFKLIFIC